MHALYSSRYQQSKLMFNLSHTYSTVPNGLTLYIEKSQLKPIFSSPEPQWLMVSYCDRWMSVVCRPSSTVASKDIS